MEQISTPNEFSFQKFFLRAWLINLLFTLTFGIILIVSYHNYDNFTATRTTFLTNLIVLPIAWVHTMLILIFSLRRFSRKQFTAGIIFLMHFFVSSVVSYYLYLILALFGWTCAMKG
jgi:hypothetical protein